MLASFRTITIHFCLIQFWLVSAVSVMSGDTNMSSVTREIEEEEARSVALEQKLQGDLKKHKVHLWRLVVSTASCFIVFHIASLVCEKITPVNHTLM